MTVPTEPTTTVATYGFQQCTLTLGWNLVTASPAVTGYRVYFGTTSDCPTFHELTASTTTVATIDAAHLTPATLYYITVTAVNADGESAKGTARSYIVRNLPNPATNCSVEAGSSQATVSWTAATLASGSYEVKGAAVYYGTTSACSTLFSVVQPSTTVTKVVTGLTPGTLYYFGVRGYNDYTSTNLSNVVSCTPFTLPSASTVSGMTAGNTVVDFNFSTPASNGGSAITQYNIYCDTNATPTTQVGTGYTSYGTHWQVTGRTNGTTYYVAVKAVNAAGVGPISNVVSVVPLGPPAAPTIGTATRAATQVTITWTAPANNGGSAITGYKVYYGTTTTPSTLFTTTGVVLTSTVTGLTNGTLYYFAVKAVNALGDSAISGNCSGTPATYPDDRSFVSITPGNGQLTYDWTDNGNGGSAITGHTVYYCLAPGGPGWKPTIVYGTTAAGTTIVTMTGLTNGQIYYVNVAPYNAVGEWPFMTGGDSTTPVGPPTVPLTPACTPGNVNNALTWATPSSNNGSAITGYKVYTCATSGGTYTLLHTLGVVLSDSHTSLTNGTAYFYKISAINAVGESAQTAYVTGTPFTVPVAPATRSAASGSDSHVDVSWTAPSSNGGSAITGYKVYNAPSSGGTYSLLHTLGVVLTDAHTGLTNGTTYYYKVSAVNAAGEGAQTAYVSATPYTVPGTVPSVAATAGVESATVTWNAPSSDGGATIGAYIIYFGTTSTPTTVYDTVSPSPRSCLVTGLTGGTLYYFRMKATNGAGNSASYSTAASCTPTVPVTGANRSPTCGIMFSNGIGI